MVYLYATDKTAQYAYVKGAEEKGYNVLLMDGQLDQHLIHLLESKLEKTRFVRVDSDIPERLIPKKDEESANLTGIQAELLTGMFRSQLPKMKDTNFIVEYEALSENEAPAVVTQNEMMRRMKDMAALQPGMNFYGQMPDMYAVVVNTNQPAVKRVLENAEKALGLEVGPIRSDIEKTNAEVETLRKEMAEKKEQSEKDELQKQIGEKEKSVAELRDKEDKLVSDYASGQPVVKQVIDLALLQANLLKGEDSRHLSAVRLNCCNRH